MVSRNSTLNWLLFGGLAIGMALTLAIGYFASSIGEPSVTDLVIEPSPATVGTARMTFRVWSGFGEVIAGIPVKIVPRTRGLTVLSEVTQTADDDAFQVMVRFESPGFCVFDINFGWPSETRGRTITEWFLVRAP